MVKIEMIDRISYIVTSKESRATIVYPLRFAPYRQYQNLPELLI